MNYISPKMNISSTLFFFSSQQLLLDGYAQQGAQTLELERGKRLKTESIEALEPKCGVPSDILQKVNLGLHGYM